MTAREVIHFTTEDAWKQARSRDITSTTVSALFGLSPYLTKFELFHRLRGGLQVADEPNERTRWGKLLQDAIGEGVGLEQQWALKRKDEYVRMPDLGIGSSFDFDAAPAETVDAGSGFIGGLVGMANGLEPQFLVETKNVDGLEFKRGWAETDFGLEAPAHIEIQVMHQLLVSGLTRCFIAALVGGNRVALLERVFDQAVGDAILAACADFWRDPAPEPDFRQDAKTIGLLYGYSEPGKVVTAEGELASLFRQYAGYKAVAREAEKDAEAAKAKILTLIGDAERVEGDTWFALTKTQAPTVVETYTRRASRPVRFYERSEK